MSNSLNRLTLLVTCEAVVGSFRLSTGHLVKYENVLVVTQIQMENLFCLACLQNASRNALVKCRVCGSRGDYVGGNGRLHSLPPTQLVAHPPLTIFSTHYPTDRLVSRFHDSIDTILDFFSYIYSETVSEMFPTCA